MKRLVALVLALLFLSACGPKEAAVTPAPSPTPRPTPTLRTLPPSPSPTPEPVRDPVCILEGEEIASLCDTAFSHDAMLTADGRLLAWREVPFDTEKCILRQDNGDWSLNIYELPLENITGAWLGRSSILALDKDGVLWGMGSNLHGQLWDAPEEAFDAPVKLTDHVVSAFISEWWCSAAVKDDGSVWLMGSGDDMTGESYLPPTQITKVKGATELYVGRYLYVRDKEGVSWRIGDIGELLDDPTAVLLSQYSGMRQLNEDLWLTDQGELVRTLPDGEEETLLTDVVDVDLSFDVYSTALTKDGDLYIWSEGEAMEDYGCSLTTSTPTKVMEGVKLAGAMEHGVTVVNETDGAVWAIYSDTLNAALTDGKLITLPERAVDPSHGAYMAEWRRGQVPGLYHRPFMELPQELLDSLTWDGEVRTEQGYNFRLRTYTAPGITLVTTEAPLKTLEGFLALQLKLPEEEREVQGDDDAVRAEIRGEKGREWLYSVTLTDDRYATALGLKVGSTVEEAKKLGYTFTGEQLAAGEATFGTPMDTHLTVTVEDGVVTQLHLSFGLGRYVGRYWDI